MATNVQIRQSPAAMMLMMGMLFVLGCQSQPQKTTPATEDLRPLRSLVFVSAEPLEPIVYEAALPWWAARHDHLPGVIVGTQPATSESEVTLTIDRQWLTNGRVHDQFYEVTYRRRVSAGARY